MGPARGSEPKVVAGVGRKTVVFSEAHDQAWPLAVVDWDGSVCFGDIANGSLGSRWQSENDERYRGKGSPCAGKIMWVDG